MSKIKIVNTETGAEYPIKVDVIRGTAPRLPPYFCGNSTLFEGGYTGQFRELPKNPFHKKVRQVLQEIEDLLVEKNESYGNSALEPLSVFSKLSASERLDVRIDDKLNRLYSGKDYGQEDTVTDLLGYLVLKKVEERLEDDD